MLWYRISTINTHDAIPFWWEHLYCHDDIIKWNYFPRYWTFVRGIHRSPVNSPHKGQWRGALMFYLICGWINGWANNCQAGDLRRYCGHYDVTVMVTTVSLSTLQQFRSEPSKFTLLPIVGSQDSPCPRPVCGQKGPLQDRHRALNHGHLKKLSTILQTTISNKLLEFLICWKW